MLILSLYRHRFPTGPHHSIVGWASWPPERSLESSTSWTKWWSSCSSRAYGWRGEDCLSSPSRTGPANGTGVWCTWSLYDTAPVAVLFRKNIYIIITVLLFFWIGSSKRHSVCASAAWCHGHLHGNSNRNGCKSNTGSKRRNANSNITNFGTKIRTQRKLRSTLI